ncbi:MAG: hypothetical protein JKP98_20270 [Rhodobacteraceae bacterium]|nr:hypothetical protein [Paracoccaceae bacterium]
MEHRARYRGVTLIEAVLFISIAMGIIVGGCSSINKPPPRCGPNRRFGWRPRWLPKRIVFTGARTSRPRLRAPASTPHWWRPGRGGDRAVR